MSHSKNPPPAIVLAPDASSIGIGPHSFACEGAGVLSKLNPQMWSHMTLDQPTFELLLFVASAVDIGAPCLLEGPTAASKTSIIAFLAALMRRPLERVNLHGQSTPDDLLGRFVPAMGWRANPRELLAHRGILSEQLVRWLESKADWDQPLTSLESTLVAAQVGLNPPQWSFVEGAIPAAMRRGHWVVIDEMNLTDAQVLESLNSVLEEPPSLFLPAQDARFGPGGAVAVHAAFRMFATMNPAGYAGRAPLSPAFRNRWRFTKAVSAPTEAEFRQMLFCGVFGEHPRVVYEGREYQGIAPSMSEAPPFAALGCVAGMRELLERIATFHAQVVGASEQKNGQTPALGSGRRDKYSFTRRDLFTVLKSLQRHLASSACLRSSLLRALDDVYLSRLDNAEDRQIVSQFLRIQGIERQHWTLGAAQATVETGATQRRDASPADLLAEVKMRAGEKKATIDSGKLALRRISKPIKKFATSLGFTLRSAHPP